MATPDVADLVPAPAHPRDNCGWCRALPPVQPAPAESGW